MSDADADWRDRLDHDRAQKDEYFADHPQSPLPRTERDSFDGLSYYAPDERYRFVLPLHEFDERETVSVGTTTEGEREYLRWGAFRFDLDGEERSLTAYRADPNEDRLWVPFTDETNGETTYGGGRYLDLDADDRRGDGTWLLDFNAAYNPFCVYSDAYECALVPFENRLDVRIEAGERVDY
ncbi:DUF1684 domain-containing protein [Halomarina salina]|uniref:DUF1684 domain-containing protein n=1 Tax=Halomarina salina TaxID=1872699 RepID=A0ABD5RH65_9EURY|nr:DUF1684 domain-containing protein [Halomarina salina]